MIGLLKKVIYLHKFSGSWSNLCSSSGYGPGPVVKRVPALGPVQVLILSVGFDEDCTHVSNSLTRSQEEELKKSQFKCPKRAKYQAFFWFLQMIIQE